jgi:RimJ/RimL family protein N-acetyltransferase
MSRSEYGAAPPTMSRSLVTNRLELRTFGPADVSDLHRIFSDPRTHTFGSGPILDEAETREWIERRADRHRKFGVSWYGLRLKGTTALIGSVGMFIGRTGVEPELGMEIRYEEQRNGYATEGARAVVEHALAVGFPTVWATVRSWNVASRTVLDRIGFRLDHTEGDGPDALIFLRVRSADMVQK